MSEDHRWRANLWIEGLQKRIPKELMDKKPTKVLEVLVPNWKGSGQNQRVAPTAGSR